MRYRFDGRKGQSGQPRTGPVDSAEMIEEQQPDNRALHERQGIAVVEDVRLLGGSPPISRMWYEP
jgi:hypothetical protein